MESEAHDNLLPKLEGTLFCNGHSATFVWTALRVTVYWRRRRRRSILQQSNQQCHPNHTLDLLDQKQHCCQVTVTHLNLSWPPHPFLLFPPFSIITTDGTHTSNFATSN